jgi:hypothetical protein
MNKKEKKPPITATQFEVVCAAVESSSNGLSVICASLVPSISKQSFYNYMQIVGPAARDRYFQAKSIQSDIIADDLLDIADDGSNDFMTVV